MRISSRRRDHRDDASGNRGSTAGDAGVASAARARGLIHEIDYGPFVAVEEAYELAEIRREDIAVDGVEGRDWLR